MTTDLTRNQSLVFGALRDAQTPLSAYTLLDKLRGDGFRAPLQVYRALEKLVDMGLVHRVESINAFVACAHPHDGCSGHGTVAFMICEKCGVATEFHDHAVDHRLADIAKKLAFKPGKTTIEIRGLCESCA
ncbi:Fur family transcriptional regulator [Peteryoungia ipomoeae]|uniref:Transcriptional repressor n=1 Tax=Peteryoungia ipomoeae TaxID=1210932 RepID=A0A4S8P546_9HYPH|nr:Fur family transcriptional regulator [Peteryoungia ipomoeae]THV25270.1 transcriptional repressor [Peteryoungia ipomoeae]